MKAANTLILGLCTAVATVAFATPHARTLTTAPSHQAVIAAIPMPTCSPDGQDCNGKDGNSLVAAIPMPTCSPDGQDCNGKNGNSLIAAIPMPTCSPDGQDCNGKSGM